MSKSIVSVHNLLIIAFLLTGKISPMKEKKHINILIRFRNGHGSAYSRNIDQIIEEEIE